LDAIGFTKKWWCSPRSVIKDAISSSTPRRIRTHGEFVFEFWLFGAYCSLEVLTECN
jgi:hypothetical protein